MNNGWMNERKKSFSLNPTVVMFYLHNKKEEKLIKIQIKESRYIEKLKGFY
jgi:hypothetical protein